MAGASGYAGGEILRLLLAHPQIEVGAVTAARSAGEAARGRPPAPRPARRTASSQPTTPRVARAATTSSSSRCRTATRPTLAAQLPDDAVVIDCGADFRLDRRRGVDSLLRHAVCRLVALRPARAALTGGGGSASA